MEWGSHGLSKITTTHGIGLLGYAGKAVARVGGIPILECRAKHPLRSVTTWSLEHVLRKYSIKTQILKDGRYTKSTLSTMRRRSSLMNSASMKSLNAL